MSERSDNNEEAQAAAPPAKKKSKLPLIILLVVLLAAGGGGYFFFFRAPAKAKAAPTKSKKKAPAAAADEGEEADEDTGEHSKDKDKDKGKKGKPSKADQLTALLPEDEEVKQVIEIPPFILNLADEEENHFLRLAMSIGLAEEAGEKPDPVFLTRLRNAVLAVLLTKTAGEVLSADGKTALRRELLEAVRAAAKEPQVHAIYITELIVQR